MPAQHLAQVAQADAKVRGDLDERGSPFVACKSAEHPGWAAPAQAALDEAVRHTSSREQFGTPLARLGPVPAMLARSWTDIEMARSLTYRAAAASARDPLANLYLSSMAKVAATEISGQVVDRAVQVMGRFGLVRGSLIERLYREARPMRIYEGATEVILDSLARQLVKRHSGGSQP